MSKTDPNTGDPQAAPAPAERKSLFKRLFSQAEPAPSRDPVVNEAWHSQAEVLSGEADPPPPDAVAPPAPPPVVDLQRQDPVQIPAPPVQAPPAQAPAVQAPAVQAPAVQAPAVQVSPVQDIASSVAQPAVEAERATETGEEEAPKRSWWLRLRDGLSRSSTSIGTGLKDIFTKRKLDDAMLEELEDVLIRADLGVATASRIAAQVGKGRYDRAVEPDEVKAILAAEVERVLEPCARPLVVDDNRPFVVLVVGVNGSGKTTTIGKLAAKFTADGKRVVLAAGDTFRAAAIAQLKVWGDRLGCQVVAREQGGDAAGLAYEAIETARESQADLLIVDTAGRLQNRTELMAELEKIIRVMRKLDPSAPHAVLLVLDATVGQNAMSQVEIFGKVAGVTGLVMTKLDGTARGGILVAIADKFKLPIHYIGVGENAADLEAFEAHDFAAAIAGLDPPRRAAAA